jgi:hypothetical protein
MRRHPITPDSSRCYFSGSAFVVFVCVVIAAVAALRKARRVVKFAARGAAIVCIGYAALLFWRRFCESHQNAANRQLEIFLWSGLPRRSIRPGESYVTTFVFDTPPMVAT